jgi:hypothetical protein
MFASYPAQQPQAQRCMKVGACHQQQDPMHLSCHTKASWCCCADRSTTVSLGDLFTLPVTPGQQQIAVEVWLRGPAGAPDAMLGGSMVDLSTLSASGGDVVPVELHDSTGAVRGVLDCTGSITWAAKGAAPPPATAVSATALCRSHQCAHTPPGQAVTCWCLHVPQGTLVVCMAPRQAVRTPCSRHRAPLAEAQCATLVQVPTLLTPPVLCTAGWVPRTCLSTWCQQRSRARHSWCPTLRQCCCPWWRPEPWALARLQCPCPWVCPPACSSRSWCPWWAPWVLPRHLPTAAGATRGCAWPSRVAPWPCRAPRATHRAATTWLPRLTAAAYGSRLPGAPAAAAAPYAGRQAAW